MNELEYKLEKINDKLTLLEKPQATFSEAFDNTPEYSEGFKDLGLMALGGAVSPIAGSLINRFLPIGNLAPAVAGLALRFIVKNNTVQKLADGMIISSLSMFIGGLLQGRIGFSEFGNDDDVSFSEQRVGGVNFG